MSKEPDFSKVKGHVYHGRSTGQPELDRVIRAAGAVPGGLRPSVPVNDLVMFHDPQTGGDLHPAGRPGNGRERSETADGEPRGVCGA